MKKHSYSKIKNLALLGIGLILGGVFATQILFSDSLETWFPNLGSGDAAVHFVTAGNDFGGLFLLRGVENVSSDGIVLSGTTITCAKKLKGLYYNSARGNRVWPLDQESLNNLKGLDSSYTTVTITGGLYMRCTGKDPASIAGQVIVTRKGTSYKLLAGVQMSGTANTYTTTRADNLQYTGGILSGKLFDNYGGVGNVLGTGLTINIDLTGIIIPIAPSYATTTNLDISIGNAPATITAPANTTITFGGLGDTTIITNPASIPLVGGNINLSGGVVIGSTTVIPGEIVQVNAPGTSLILYQAGNTNSYIEVPDNTYVIGPSGWNNIRYSPTIVGNTITFGGNTPLLFIPPIKIFFANIVVSGSNNLPKRINYGETIRHTITTMCNTPFNTLPTNISLTGANKECYMSSGVNTIIRTHHATQFQIPPITRPSQGGGMQILTKDSCKISSTNTTPGTNEEGIDYSPSYYDHSCVGPIIPEEEPPHEIVSVCFGYNEELNQAYDFAYSFDITTINPCEQVRMYDNLIRKDMAKMMVNFVIKVLNRQDIYVDNPSCENYTDINAETSEMTFYIQTACKLGLMGLEFDGITPQQKFNPYGIVTRAQFGTVLSRLLRGADNGAHGSAPYYQEHLSALKETNIMKQIAKPEMKERRGRVFIMMNRIYNMGINNQ